jgi:pyruvate/2-oxoglutarate dehydrogenase complex dihydrolipoamide dehydrogenase (E3) component/uncharacterized membrane protein YdjX (TVP38/TMEM64 family)
MKSSRWFVLAALAAVAAAFFALDLGRFLSLEYLRGAQLEFRALYGTRPALVVGGYFAAYVAVTALSLPGATAMTLLGGAIFGLGVGTVVVSFASTIGATLAMLTSRHLLRGAVQARFGARLAEVDRGIARDGAFYLFTLRLVPVLPFFALNLLMGLTAMRGWTFAWVSQLGMLAGTVVYVNAGTQLAQLDSLGGIVSPGLLGAFALLGVFPLLSRRLAGMVRARRVYARWAHRRPKRYDRNLVVIGAGAAGLVTSYIAAAVKARVTLVEAHRMGGDCLNTGCVPSKALIRTATLVQQMRHSGDYGVARADFTLDFAQVMARVARVVREIEPHDSVERYRGLGVDVQHGHARIVDPWHVEIRHDDGTKSTLSTRAIVVATGARPFVPPLPGLAEAGVLTSDTIWSLRELPRRLVVLGGGPIGCELAQAFARLGAQVTQVEMAPRLLVREDVDVGAFVRARLEADGVRVLTAHQAVRCERVPPVGTPAGPDRPATPGPDPVLEGHPDAAAGLGPEAGAWELVAMCDGAEVRIPFDRVLCAVGRVARLEGFGLEELGIATGRTLPVDEHLQTIYPNILACGDVAGPYQLTHVAAHQAWYAAVNGLFGTLRRFKADYRVIPWCTFVDPEVARVGLNEQEARERGIAFETTRYGLDDLDRAIADSTAQGWVQVLTEPGRDRILGVTIVGAHAGDLLAEYVLAMKHGLGLNKILGTIHTYPTMAEANKYAAGQWKRAHQPHGLLRWVQRFHDWRRG